MVESLFNKITEEISEFHNSVENPITLILVSKGRSSCNSEKFPFNRGCMFLKVLLKILENV